ncbi:antA/AntB antirepressor family protein [Corynebacterium ulcerans]|uniref:antA/AntB antirepressor family protein n=1 Tax=Corynebacterium ulcerans TaxID=65058 RepID=UPI000C772837|nr:antA/AntB antirepressor family protein [Corynebacterium ulcerans]PLW01849.1 hypothetical protein BRL54_09525 [Corynebacterium ulcerans]
MTYTVKNDRVPDWLPRMVEYGFEDGKDYLLKIEKVQDSLGRKRESYNHIISLDMAKEISMIQRTDKGKQALQNTVMTCLYAIA